jgi:signal transduction histidine kinase
MMEGALNLAQNEEALHHYDKAFAYQKIYSSLKDSAYTASSAKSMAEMETRYQAEKKEKEIVLLKKDQELSQLSLQKQKNFQVGAIVLIILILLIGFLLLNRYKVVQRAKQLVDMERMRNNIARDLHDDIGSTLSSINILSKVALQQEAGQQQAMAADMQKIKDRSAVIMDSMSDIVWAIHPQNDTVAQMLARMKEFTAELLDPLNINYTFREEGDFSAVKLDVKTRKDVYLLFKEAINNAAKYSRCGQLAIRLWLQGPSLHLSVSDDGIGFNLQQAGSGNGLRNMRERAASMGAVLQISSDAGKGTQIALDLPIT